MGSKRTGKGLTVEQKAEMKEKNIKQENVAENIKYMSVRLMIIAILINIKLSNYHVN